MKRNQEHYCSFTELEGILDTVETDAAGKGVLGIRDILTGRHSICRFIAEEPEALDRLINRKVRVFGKARYDREDNPYSIDVKDYEPLEKTTSIDEIHHHGFRLEGELSSQDIIRRMREMDA